MKPNHVRLREMLAAYKLEQGCTDCGYSEHSAALEFDHLPGSIKLFKLAQAGNRNVESIWAEVAKCEVVCSCCHQIRTYERRRNENA